MNPNAASFSFSAGASEWTPGGAAPPPPPPATEAKPVPEEKDKLWKCVLKLANGDRTEAKRLLKNPAELIANEAIWDHMDLVDLEKLEKAQQASPAPPPPAEEEKVVEEVVEVQEEDPREHLNVVFIGHVDAGKSTLSGNILYLTGYVDKRTIEKYEREAKQRNRESWFLAFIMDTNEEERAKGKTVEVGRAPFETEAKRYTILDAPGHKNYVPHMISGAAQADVGILVISARRGEFETGFERGGQTREHAMLCKTLGVRFLIVVINKMDDPTVRVPCLCIWYTYIQIYISWYRVDGVEVGAVRLRRDGDSTCVTRRSSGSASASTSASRSSSLS
jgi:small GTP-binding protein